MRMMPVGLLCAALCVPARPGWAQTGDGTAADTPGIERIHAVVPPAPSRPALLLPLYVGNAGLQAFDGYSTLAGVRQGCQETNPLVGSLASWPAALWATKAASAAGTIVVSELLWRHQHRKQAVVLMLATDALMAAVGARNASILAAAR